MVFKVFVGILPAIFVFVLIFRSKRVLMVDVREVCDDLGVQIEKRKVGALKPKFRGITAL